VATEPKLLAEVFEVTDLCYPLTELDVIRHEPDNRFIECALAARVNYLITVNAARGHFDRNCYGSTKVVTPGEFVNLSAVHDLLRRI